jgi:hypothetical protein
MTAMSTVSDPYVVNPKASVFCTCKALRDKAKFAATKEVADAYMLSLLSLLDNFGIYSNHADYYLLRYGCE